MRLIYEKCKKRLPHKGITTFRLPQAEICPTADIQEGLEVKVDIEYRVCQALSAVPATCPPSRAIGTRGLPKRATSATFKGYLLILLYISYSKLYTKGSN